MSNSQKGKDDLHETPLYKLNKNHSGKKNKFLAEYLEKVLNK